MSSGSADTAVPRARHRYAWTWAPVVVYLLLIFGLSSISGPPALPADISDKTAHVLLYSGLGFLLMRAFAGALRTAARLPQLLLAVSVGALYGGSDELHQFFVPGRSCELLDWVSDLTGAALGSGAFWAWAIIAERLSRSHRSGDTRERAAASAAADSPWPPSR